MHGLQTIRSLNDRADNEAKIKAHLNAGQFVVARYHGKDPAGVNTYSTQEEATRAAQSARQALKNSGITVQLLYPTVAAEPQLA